MTIIDSRHIGTVDGFDIDAHLEPDTDTSPWDYPDVYSDGDEYVTAYQRGDWDYVGTVVTASRAGVELGSASIWGQEHGMWPGEPHWISPLDGDGDNFANGYGPQLIDEAITEARVTLAKLVEK